MLVHEAASEVAAAIATHRENRSALAITQL